MKKLLVIDGNSILNRAFFGVRPLSNSDGLPTNAVFGMTSIFLKQLDTVQPDYAAVAFDLPQPTFRHTAYAEYKAGRKAMPDELARQLPYAKECAAALGFHVIEKAGYEADDILGTLAQTAQNEDIYTYILTGDRDSLQLINDRICVLLSGNTDTVTMDETAFAEKYGIPPNRHLDVKALMGDSSDNIPGVPGVGEKTAFKLISEFSSLDGVYENLDSPSIGKSVREKLSAGREKAYLSRFLAEIKKDVPLDVSLNQLAYGGINKKRTSALFKTLEFTAFLKKLNLDSAGNAEPDETQTDIKTNSPDWLSGKNKLAVHFENDRIYLSDGAETCLFSDSAESLFQNEQIRFCVYDLKSILARYPFVSSDDVMLCAYAVNPSDTTYDLSRLAYVYLGESGDCSLPSRCAAVIYRLWEHFEKLLTEQKLMPLYHEIELPLCRVLSDMEKIGFKVDTDGLARFSEKLGTLADGYTDDIYRMSGEVFNINSPKQLGEVLFEKMGLPSPKKTKTGYSTNSETLEKLRPYHPIIEKIFDYRQVVKLKSTYADGLVKCADENGRVHTTFNQTVTATGRLSSTEPNLQNIPIRQELGREMRKFFVPSDKDHVLVDADYSQIELRLLACIAGDERMISAFQNGDDIHTITASQVFNVPMNAVTPELRKRAKAVNFGIVYGISEFSLAEDIGVSRFEAAQYILSYFAKYPQVSEYMDNIKAQAYRTGFVTTLFGRRRYIPELSSSKAPLRSFGERVAMNSPIQGTAADVIKIAMIRVHQALKESGLDARLILQVHDELVVESRRDCAPRAAQILQYEMENAVKLPVVLTAEVSIADNWYH